MQSHVNNYAIYFIANYHIHAVTNFTIYKSFKYNYGEQLR